MKKRIFIIMLAALLCLSGCGSGSGGSSGEYVCDKENSHAVEADGTTETFKNITVKKSGDGSGDNADFYGTNAAVFAQNGAQLTISDSVISTDGEHANAVFSYGEGTVISISNTQIDTYKSTSGGIMVTGGGTLNAEDLTVTTRSGSSAPIRSDRGGGKINVNGGTYKSYGSGSPAVYSTADINIENAELYSDIAEAVVIEGKNSVTITDSSVTGKNTVHNSDEADVYRNIMIYQSMSGDAAAGKGEFSMTGGTLTSQNGGMFFVTNTVADIVLENVAMNYASDDLLRIEKAGWGNDGSNGGQVNFYAKNQQLEGDVTVDEISVLNMYLENGSSLCGSVSSAGKTYVEIDEGSTWTLTADSSVTALTCGSGCVILNGHTLTVNGTQYAEGTASSGQAIEITMPDSQMPDGEPPAIPDGEMPNGQEPPAKPDGQKPDGEMPDGEPPAKPV